MRCLVWLYRAWGRHGFKFTFVSQTLGTELTSCSKLLDNLKQMQAEVSTVSKEQMTRDLPIECIWNGKTSCTI